MVEEQTSSIFVTVGYNRADIAPGHALVPSWQRLHIRSDAPAPEDGEMGCSLLWALASVVAIQDPQATVTGTVTNAQSHEPIAGLVVTLTDLSRAARTDSSGRYIFRQTPPGPHHVAVRYFGFSPRTLHAIVPSHGTLEINVALTPVEMHLPTLLVRHAAVDRTGGRSAVSLMNDQQHSITEIRSDPRFTEPDVLLSVTRGDVVTRPESPNGLYVRGGSAAHVAYALDGIPVFNPYHTSGMFSAWSPDAIAGMELSSTLPSPGDAASLSGTVSGITRTPAVRIQSSASLSTTQARFALDGPLRWRDGGFLLSVRSGFPSVGVPASDASYIRGGSSDRIAKLELTVLGGRLRMLNYSSEDDVNTSGGAEEPSTTRAVRRNAFEWSSGSIGAEWTGKLAGTGVRALTWRATSDASAQWPALRGLLQMAAARRDQGLLLDATKTFGASSFAAGVRLERSGTSYHVDFQSDSVRDTALESRMIVSTGFARYQVTLAKRATITAGTALARFKGETYASPQAQLQWHASPLLSFSASYARRHQFTQSLRNEESMAGSVFPVDLYLGAGTGNVPVARSHHGVLSAEYRPVAAIRLGAQAYQRRFADMVLVAPVGGDPFSTGSLSIGSGVSHGGAVDASINAARIGIVASYGFQKVRFTSGGTSYAPSHGSTHMFDGGILVFPSPTLSVRLGASGSAGRRTTNVGGGFEWEACNLRDRGCEFGGAPRSDTAALGRSPLPAYVRADIGVRKHWHLEIGRRDATLALFGAVTNVFGRRNLLTFSRDELSGALMPVEMRPFAPLVVGLEWKF